MTKTLSSHFIFAFSSLSQTPEPYYQEETENLLGKHKDYKRSKHQRQTQSKRFTEN